jgi:rubrerythrin
MRSQAWLEAGSGERATGTPNTIYDLSSVLFHALQGGASYDKYIEDAEREGDEELTEFFRRVREEDRDRAAEARLLLAQRTPPVAGAEDTVTGVEENEGSELDVSPGTKLSIACRTPSRGRGVFLRGMRGEKTSSPRYRTKVSSGRRRRFRSMLRGHRNPLRGQRQNSHHERSRSVSRRGQETTLKERRERPLLRGRNLPVISRVRSQ